MLIIYYQDLERTSNLNSYHADNTDTLFSLQFNFRTKTFGITIYRSKRFNVYFRKKIKRLKEQIK